MRPVRILSVCGSGTVSSAMLSTKLSDVLESNGYKIKTTEVSPGGVANAIANASYDLIAFTSPVTGNYGIPILNATGFLIGINEEQFVEQLLDVVKNLDLK